MFLFFGAKYHYFSFDNTKYETIIITAVFQSTYLFL